MKILSLNILMLFVLIKENNSPIPPCPLFGVQIIGGVSWTKFEHYTSKIQMIKTTKADSAGRNNLSGGMDSPCLG